MNKNNISKKEKKGNINSELLKIELITVSGDTIKFKEQKQITRVESEFMLIWQDGLKRALQLNLNLTERIVFEYCLCHVDKSNEITLSPTEIAKDHQLARETISRAISTLLKNNLISLVKKNKNSASVYCLNPEIGGRGRLKNLNQARKQALKENPSIDDLAAQVLSELSQSQAEILKKYIEKQEIKASTRSEKK